jgi:pimeloyl-ACP methyl ester carboxylesterase
MNPTKSGYADVNNRRDARMGAATAKTWQVIAVEMQGHGRTADAGRPMNFPTMGNDIAALLDYLKISKADLVGHSFGGAGIRRRSGA